MASRVDETELPYCGEEIGVCERGSLEVGTLVFAEDSAEGGQAKTRLAVRKSLEHMAEPDVEIVVAVGGTGGVAGGQGLGGGQVHIRIIAAFHGGGTGDLPFKGGAKGRAGPHQFQRLCPADAISQQQVEARAAAHGTEVDHLVLP